MYASQLESYKTAKNSNITGRGNAAGLAKSTPLPSFFRKNGDLPAGTMYAPQLETYKTSQHSLMSGREIEAAALTRCALMLAECQQNWGAADHEEKLTEALKINQKVWSIFQSELPREENPLPRQIKENILNLSLFIDKRIIEVMSYPAPEKLKIIIDINNNLAAGLRGSAG